MATAKNRAIDLMRRDATLERKQEELARDVGIQMRDGPAPTSRRRSTTRSATTCSA